MYSIEEEEKKMPDSFHISLFWFREKKRDPQSMRLDEESRCFI